MQTNAVAVEKSASVAKVEILDLNTAPEEKLQTLPGVTKEVADKIIAGRPYTDPEDLVSKQVVTKEIFRYIWNRIFVGPGSAVLKSKTTPA